MILSSELVLLSGELVICRNLPAPHPFRPTSPMGLNSLNGKPSNPSSKGGAVLFQNHPRLALAHFNPIEMPYDILHVKEQFPAKVGTTLPTLLFSFFQLVFEVWIGGFVVGVVFPVTLNKNQGFKSPNHTTNWG